MKLFADFTPWEILEIFSHKNAHYCLQVRANKSTGMKYFRTTMIIETENPAQMRNISVETINRLIRPKSVSNENSINTIKGGKMKFLIGSGEEISESAAQMIKRQRKSRVV